MFRVAGALLHDPTAVEDVVHDVFVAFASQAGRFELRGSLKGYLAICVANRARNVGRQDKPVCPKRLREVGPQPDVVGDLRRMRNCMRRSGRPWPNWRRSSVRRSSCTCSSSLRFREIARQTGESVNTVKSRYRYGIAKLRSQLNGQVEQ